MTRCHEKTGSIVDANLQFFFPFIIYINQMRKIRIATVLSPSCTNNFLRSFFVANYAAKHKTCTNLRFIHSRNVDVWYKDFYVLLAMNIMNDTLPWKDRINCWCKFAIFFSFYHIYKPDEENKNSHSIVSKLYK